MVEKIRFKGKEYPLRVSYKALRKTRYEIGRDFKSSEKAFDYEGAECLLYHALSVGAKEADTELDIDRKEMVDVLDEDGNFNAFLEAYSAFFLSPPKAGAGS